MRYPRQSTKSQLKRQILENSIKIKLNLKIQLKNSDKRQLYRKRK